MDADKHLGLGRCAEAEVAASRSDQANLIARAWNQVAELVAARAGCTHSSASGREPRVRAPAGDFPGYRLVEEIHSGGQGVVYKALQESTSRYVAIKVLHERARQGESDLARFAQEIRILGQLRHPNIVRIYDGSVAAGRVYYVMDYIAGRRLDEFVFDERLSVASVVRLFIKVCEAVAAAHLRGIIHRDLKPGNIRVDASGEPFVLDFGLSKRLSDDVSDVTLSGQFVGSPLWSSPEQAAGGGAAVDLRTDVYSLGVVLYHLLTRAFPQSFGGAVLNVLRQIREEPPTPPRTRNPRIPADLETIILKCLQKDAERRYQSAGDLARDLKHFLRGEAIEARRDSLSYVLRTQLRRHRVAALGGAAFLAALIGGLAAALTFWRQAETARIAAARQVQIAGKQARIAGAASAFLADMLARADRGEQGGNADVRVREVLDEAAALLAGENDYEPEVRETLCETIGRTYQALGLFEQAEPRLREALKLCRARVGESHPDYAAALRNVGSLLLDRAALDECEAVMERALALRRSLLAPDDPLIASSLSDLAAVRRARRDYSGAERLYREALALWAVRPPQDPSMLAGAKTSLALVLSDRGAFAEADSLCREALELANARHGADHPAVAGALSNLAAVLDRGGRADAAEAYYRQALEMRRRLLGEEHALVATSLNNLGGFLHETRGDLDAAEPLLRGALEMRRRLLGEENPLTLGSLEALASLLQDRGRLEEAEALYLRALSLHRTVGGVRSVETASCLNNLATLALARGRTEESVALLREAVSIRRELGATHVNMAVYLGNLAVALGEQAAYDEAAAQLREALAIQRTVIGEEHEEIARTLINLGAALNGTGDYVEAERVLGEALRQARMFYEPSHPRLLACLSGLGLALSEVAWCAPDEPNAGAVAKAEQAESLLRECLAARSAALAPEDAALATTRSHLGNALYVLAAISAGAGDTTRGARLVEAETLLTEGAEGLVVAAERKQTPAARLAAFRAMQRVVRLYDALERLAPEAEAAAKGAAWRKRVAEWVRRIPEATRPAPARSERSRPSGGP